MVVTKNLRFLLTLLVSATGLPSRRLFAHFCSTGGIQAPTFIRRIHHNEDKTHFNCNRHNSTTLREARAISVHHIEECTSPASARGATICTIHFCFGIARVWDHSPWYADKLVVQLNGCARRRRPKHLCADGKLASVAVYAKKISTLLGGPFHSGAPRLCLPCLPCRDATALKWPEDRPKV